MSTKGYVLLYMPDHHRADKRGRVMEHIVVWEQFYDRVLPDGWVIHHINHIKNDNSPENLRAMLSCEHTKLHNSGRKLSEETKRKISESARKRLAVKENHPRYKPIDILEMNREILEGATVKQTCLKYNINKTTYYKKIKENKNGKFLVQ